MLYIYIYIYIQQYENEIFLDIPLLKCIKLPFCWTFSENSSAEAREFSALQLLRPLFSGRLLGSRGHWDPVDFSAATHGITWDNHGIYVVYIYIRLIMVKNG